jgi:hypothetical protein
MSEYLVLNYESEAAWENADPVTVQEMMDDHRIFGEQNGAVLRGGNALQPTMTATSLRRNSSGELLITDGAFAETKEALGGLLRHRGLRS